MSGTRPDREAQVTSALARVEDRIEAACARAGRERAEVTLVVVTKFFPPSDVRLLHRRGVRHVGENRHQEAVAKVQECQRLELTWHFIGHLQTNKAAAVGQWADVVQSVDRVKLLPGLSKAAHLRNRPVDVLLQVSLDSTSDRDRRGGVAPEDVSALAAETAAAEGLRLRGVMGVAPLGGDPEHAFALLAAAAADVRLVEPAATWLSAGMSGDLETAIAHGATHVRVGNAVLGNRPGHR